MYGMQYPIDRLLAVPFQGQTPLNINYQQINVAPQLAGALPAIAFTLAIQISQRANMNALRVYYFNKLSQNNWNNEFFLNAVGTVANMMASRNLNPNDSNAVHVACGEAIGYFTAKEYLDNYNVLSPYIDANTQAQLNMYLQQNGMVRQQTPYAQPNPAMGAMMQTSPSYAVPPANIGGGIASIGNPTDDKYAARLKPQEIPMDRTQHQMGVEVPTQIPGMQAAPNPVQRRAIDIEVDDVVSDIYGTGYSLESKSMEANVGEHYSSFIDLADKIFTDYEDFFVGNRKTKTGESKTNFVYVYPKEFEYGVSLAPFTHFRSMDFKERFLKFIHEEYDRESMLHLMSKVPGKIRRLLNIFLEDLRLRTNNLIALANCKTVLEQGNTSLAFIEDYGDLLLNLAAKSRKDIIDDLKIALQTWINDSLSLEELVSEGEKTMTLLTMRCKVIVVDVSSEEMSRFTPEHLDFLCEMRVNTLFVVTNNNTLFKVEMMSKKHGDVYKHYTPVRIFKLLNML